MNYIPQFIAFWTMPCLNELVIQHVFQDIFHILLPDSVSKFRLHSSSFFIILRTLFLLVKHAFMSAIARIRLSNTVPLAYVFSTFMRGGKARPKAGFQFNVQKQPVPESSWGSLAKNPCLDTSTQILHGGRKSSGGVSVRLTDCRKESHGVCCF